MIDILEAGAGTSVQDLGRSGYAAWGIGPGGAADRGSLRLANRLVGNREGAAAFEVVLGGLAVRFRHAALVAITGAPVGVLLDGRPLGRMDGPQSVPAGTTLSFTPPAEQVRSYLAVRGGLDTEVVLGSRSVDESIGIGRALRAGDAMRAGTAITGPPPADQAPRRGWPAGPLTLAGTLGPRDDWFTDDAVRRFGIETYAVTPATDRVGVRLEGPPPERVDTRELRSEPPLRGAIEIPADGQPIVFGADHPTTCGYPVIGVLHPDAADLIGQCRPGQQVTFRLRRPEIRLTI